MGVRAYALADQIEQVGKDLVVFTEDLSEAEWQVIVPGEGRPVGVLILQLAAWIPSLVDFVGGLAARQPIARVTWDNFAGLNSQHTQEQSVVNQQQAIDLLLTNTRAAADKVRQLTDKQLDNTATICFYSDTPLTAQWFIEYYAVGYNYHLLDSIRTALSH